MTRGLADTIKSQSVCVKQAGGDIKHTLSSSCGPVRNKYFILFWARSVRGRMYLHPPKIHQRFICSFSGLPNTGWMNEDRINGNNSTTTSSVCAWRTEIQQKWKSNIYMLRCTWRSTLTIYSLVVELMSWMQTRLSIHCSLCWDVADIVCMLQLSEYKYLTCGWIKNLQVKRAVKTSL